MRKILKLAISTFIIIGLLTTPLVGEEASKELNIVKLEEIISVSSLDIQIAKYDVVIGEYKLNQAEDNKGTGATPLESQKNQTYNIDTAKKELEYLKSKSDEVVNKVVLEGKNLYYTYTLKDKEIALLNSKISRLNTDLSNINTKIKLGMALESDAATKELEIRKVQLQIEELNISKNEIVLKLNQYLMWDIETVIEIVKTDLPELGKLNFNLTDIKEYQLVNNLEIIRLEAETKLANENLRIVNAINSSDDTITKAKEAVTDAGYSVKDQKLQVELNVYSSYNTLLNLRDTITLNELEAENSKSDYERLVKRFEVGFETQSTLDASQEIFYFAELALDKSKLEYYIAYEEFIRLGESN